VIIRDVVFVYHLVENERVAWHGRFHSHGQSEYELHLFLDGYGTFLCDKKRYPITPGKLFLTPPQEFHSIIPDKTARPISYYAILFYVGDDDSGLASLLSLVFENRLQMLTVSDSYRFQCEDITQLFRSENTSLSIAATYLLLSLVYRIYQIEHTPDSPEKEPGGSVGVRPKAGESKSRHIAGAHVAKVIAVMQAHVRSSIGIDEIARILMLSTEHLCRIFRAETKMSPHQYFMRLKIEGASGFLISTSKTIGEIADWFGFENQFHFSRVFKSCTGLSPLRYRKTYLQTIDFSQAAYSLSEE
jgi:AraC-like DNA-binding protein